MYLLFRSTADQGVPVIVTVEFLGGYIEAETFGTERYVVDGDIAHIPHAFFRFKMQEISTRKLGVDC